ncbi:hypothetical protein A8C56_19840 [Niabella ginsenosidivorans]|uniref:DUF1800 domain-containing protein n=1 Tax=Niabella ginsenosidivorans TaxID=1176587 RepID=A0A1A9I7C0_9BACT|nr:DUF1800 domain-containing protein [Niabella ginsenosidivorans]ANH82939.1 hypothetical protein A8C56_19840 [Niabella ginsenosidivorans]
MVVNNQLKNQHLLWRAGFGPAVEQLQELAKYTPQEYYQALVKASAKKPEYINIASDELLALYENYLDPAQRSKLTTDDKKILNRKQQQGVKDLNLYWLKEMVGSAAQLREKMAFFWHGHFACRNGNLFYNQLFLHTLRENALGNFRALLKEVSKSAAMLYFLNNQQNKKGHPNENFAREVMELFTLGRGHYTETDIKEGARAFTGWTANARGEFNFIKKQHDEGIKTFLDKKGNFDGDQVLDIIADNPQTARFITEKIYKFFVNENVDKAIVQDLSDSFYKDYDIGKLMGRIFTADWFYDEKNIGIRIKSPIELLVGIQRMVPMRLDNDNALMNLQRILGQQLLYPPNVAGWPGGRSWIDSSTLMMRLRIPQLFNDKDLLNVKPKQDDDVMMGRKADGLANIPAAKQEIKKQPAKPGAGLINAKIDWAQYVSGFDKVKREDLFSAISGCLFQVNAANADQVAAKYVDSSDRGAYIRSATVQLMSTPEYQMC